MLKQFLSIGFAFISFALSAQIDSIRIAQQLKEEGGYSKLIERFTNSDSTLTIEDFKLIYYGYQLSPSYYSKENEFKEYKKVMVEDGELKITPLKSYRMTTKK